MLNFRFYDLEGRTIVLTGATRGIGKAIAPALARQGLRLILIGNELGALDEVCSSLRKEGHNCESVFCDLSDALQRESASYKIRELAPNIDGIIHNAGIDPRRPLSAMDTDFIRGVFAVNVEPAIELTRLLLPELQKSSAGRIVLVGSVTFELGTSYLSAYASSKGALVGLTRSLAHELGSSGITVNCIAPGAVAVEKEIGRITPEAEAELISWQSVQRRLVPDDLAGVLCLLLSDAGSAITGQTITVDGGIVHPLASTDFQQLMQGE